MKKPLAFRGLLLPFIAWFFWLILSLVSLWVINETTSLDLTSNLYYIKVLLAILFFIGFFTMIVSIIRLGREKWLVQREMFASSRELLKTNFGKFALFTVIILVLSLFQNLEVYPEFFLPIVWIVSTWFAYWITNFSLLLVKKQKADYKDVIVWFNKFIKSFVAQILTWILVFVSAIFLVIPWIYVALRLSMAVYLILDQDLWPIAALKKSWAITKNKVPNIFAINIILSVIAVLWFLLLGVWLLWAIPLYYLVNVTLYTKILALEK